MTRLLCAVLLVACSGKPGAPAHPGGGSQTTDRGSGSGAGSETQSDPPIVAREDTTCDKLIDHVVTLAVAERPAEQKPTDAERSKLATDLRSSWTAKCKQMTKHGYDCVLAAGNLTALDRCGG